MTATSTEQSTDNSCAFLNRPPLRFRKVLISRQHCSLIRHCCSVRVKKSWAQVGSDKVGQEVTQVTTGCSRAFSCIANEQAGAYSHRTVPIILDGLDLNLPSTHRCDYSGLPSQLTRAQSGSRCPRRNSGGWDDVTVPGEEIMRDGTWTGTIVHTSTRRLG